MNKFFSTCRRCLNPWVILAIIGVVIALIIFVPIIGVASLIVALPFIGCTIMCGVMVLFMGKKENKVNKKTGES